MEFNPYAAPQAEVIPVAQEAEVVRRQHISTESTIKTIGILYYLGAFGLIVAGIGSLAETPRSGELEPKILGAFFILLGVAYGFVAFGLRRLRGWTRVPTIILCSIGLLGFPLGTLINLYFLVKVAGKQGKFVMTPEYQQIIAATPHVKHKTSIVTWVILILLLIVLIGIIASIAMG